MRFDLFSKKEEAMISLLAIEESWKSLPDLSLKSLDPDQTAIVFVDVIKGFVSQGPLSSERAKDITLPVKRLNEETRGFHKIYFQDCHTKDSTEFAAYVPHCLKGTAETELISELIPEAGERSRQIEKNCINGFMAAGFQTWLTAHPEVVNFVIAGLVTDICVLNFSLTLKSYFNEKNIVSRLMLPLTTVETFDLPATNHQAELMNTVALYQMQMNGIELYRDFA
jgi:amidase from nicotinamidase family